MGKEERRIAILQAAGRIFYLKGFEGTKIEDVAKEAGIGKGTVYEYFASKQELFEEMISYNRELYLSNIRRILQSADTFRERFIALARYQTELVRQHIQVFNAMACSKIMAREIGALMLEQNTRVEEILKSLVKEAVSRGELRADVDPEVAAGVMIGTINQYCSKKVIFFHVEPQDLNFADIVDTVIKGIGEN